MSENQAGTAVITRNALLDTFAMWQDRGDQFDDGVDYVNEIRRGTRLDRLIKQQNEKHHPMTDVTVLVPYQRGQ